MTSRHPEHGVLEREKKSTHSEEDEEEDKLKSKKTLNGSNRCLLEFKIL
jgi:hypothetical protein